MNNIASFSIINQKVNKILNEEGDKSKGMAFIMLCLRTLFKLNDDEIEESITDGPMDGEVDAIYISNRIINIMTFKYTDSFEISKRNYPESELDQYILTIDSIINGSLEQKTINDALWDKYKEILSLSTSGKVEFKIYVISNKQYPADQARIKLENIISKYRVVEKPIYINQEDLVAKILENKEKKLDGKIHFIDRQHFEKSDGKIKTVIGVVAAKDIIELIKDPINLEEINEYVFNENVRGYKEKHRVNKSIIESAKDNDNYLFFYLNNGITLLCENVDYIPNTRNPLVSLKNFQIINGGQTSHSLFRVFKENPEKLDTVELLIRVCVADGEDPISQKISETSNNQIPVGNRDLHSNDLIQKKLEEDFSTLGYYYERKPNQYDEKPKNKVLSNEVLGQLFMAYHLEMPSEAKNNKAKVFSELYDSIFDENVISAEEFLRLYKLYLPLLEKKKIIQNKKRKKEFINEKEAFVSRATFHILYGTKFFFDQEVRKIELQDISQAEKKNKVNIIYENKGVDFIDLSINLLFQIVELEMNNRGEQYTHDKFFKEIPTNHIIRNYFLSVINEVDSF